MSMLWACPRGHYRPRTGETAGPPPGTCPVCGEPLVAFPEFSPPTERRPAGRARETAVRLGPATTEAAIIPLPPAPSAASSEGDETLTGTPPSSGPALEVEDQEIEKYKLKIENGKFPEGPAEAVPPDSIWDTLLPAVPAPIPGPEADPGQFDETLATPPGAARPPTPVPVPPQAPPPPPAPPVEFQDETLTADDRGPTPTPLPLPPLPPREEGGETLARPPEEAPTTPEHKTWATDRFDPAKAKRPTASPEGPPTQPAPAPGSASFSWAAGSGYEILGVLGRGGMGVVYKARQVALNRVVALKMILSGAHASPEDLARFKTEAQAVAALQHPNIVQVYEVGEREGRPYFSLEFVDGGSLQQRLDGTPLEPREAAQLMMAIARGIHFAHQNRIIHRDLKPANVLLALKDPARPRGDKPPPLSECVPKITDFGLAKKLDEEALGHTGTEAILGTPTYMAPEQAEGRTREVGPAADIYALGAVLYDLLTGRPPFRGTTVMDTLMQVLSDEPVPPRRLQPGVPLDLQTICLRCLEKNPTRRYPTAALLADDLERFLDGRPIEARPVGPVERAVKWARRRPAVAGLLGLSALLVVGLPVGGVAFALHEKNRADTEAGLRRDKEAAAEAERRAKEAAQKSAKEEREAKDALKERNAALTKTQEALRTQIKRTQESKQEAQDSFLDAQAAVNQLILVAQKHLRNAPGLEKVREELIADAVRLCERFVDRKGDDPEVRLQAARAHRLMGDLHELLGKAGEATRHYRDAARLFEGLIGDPKLPSAEWKGDYRKELSDVYQGLWVVLEESDPLAAEAALRKALAEVQKGVEKSSWAAGRKKAEAAVHNNLGILYHRRNDPNKAEEEYREAEKFFGELHAQSPSRPDYTLELARAKVNRGALLIKGQPQQARDLLNDAVKLLKPLVDRYPREPDYAKELGRAYTNLGVLEGSEERGGGAARHREGSELFTGLADRFPHVPDYRHLRAVSRVNVGRSLLGVEGQEEECERALAEGRDALERLVEDFPEDAGYRRDLALACAGLGMVRSRAGDLDGAREFFERGLELARGLAAEKPSDREYQEQRARSFGNLIALLDRQARDLAGRRRWAEAEEAVRRLVEQRRERLREEVVADSAEERAELASTLLAWADALLHVGKHAEAAGLVPEMTRLAPSGWEKSPRVAGVLARCVGRVLADTSLTLEERDARARELAEKALELLGSAAREGLGDREYVRTSEDFRALRTHPDFGMRFGEVVEGWKAGD